MPYGLRLLADLLFPADCEACGAPLAPGHGSCLCPSCRSRIVPPPPPLCARCGIPVRRAGTCADCLRRPPRFARARASGLYLSDAGRLNPLAAAVCALKYRRRRPVAWTLARLLADRYPFSPDAVLVPVPLHLRRLRERGFNQSLLLARGLSRWRRLAVEPRALVRVRPTTAQPGLSRAERERNLGEAFAVRDAARIRDRHVVLVDDVLTTGATANACAAALLAGGALRVDVYTVGRAL
ncbi:MAG TPA: double zinc ribbon domain-containing protein [Candidatus Binatia bacterium]|nr:double zinc ribbon domain-containing protein [Candidatus Binatia bacterium]